jgi:hypothetical protein
VRPLTVIAPPATAAERRSMPVRARRLLRLADVMYRASTAPRGANGHRSVRWIAVTGETLVATLIDHKPARILLACDEGTREPCRLELEDTFRGQGKTRAPVPDVFPTSSELALLADHVVLFARALERAAGGDAPMTTEEWHLCVCAVIGASHSHPDQAKDGPITLHTATSPLGPEGVVRSLHGDVYDPADDAIPPPPGLPDVMIGRLSGRAASLSRAVMAVAPLEGHETMEALRALALLHDLTGWSPAGARAAADVPPDDAGPGSAA